jgi:stage III sporulation protein AB
MLLKILGSLIVVAGCSLLGYVFSRDCVRRPQQLRELQNLLQIFENHITYLSMPLIEAFTLVGQAGGTEAAILFKLAAEKLSQKSCFSASEAWEAAVKEGRKHTALNHEDESILLIFGRMLGSSDLEGQLKNIELAKTQLKMQEQKAEDNRKKNEKMYKGLGVLGGLAIVIILF